MTAFYVIVIYAIYTKNTFLTANGCCPQRLEQEKHVLRRKLSAAESESDIRAQELETDFNDLQKKMMTQVRRNLIVVAMST